MALTTESTRTFSDRKAFLIAENTIELANELVNKNKVEPEIPKIQPPTDPNWEKKREKGILRESIELLRKKVFLETIGKLTFIALPLDHSEKMPFRNVILEQSADFAESLKDWKPNKVIDLILENINIIFERMGDENSSYENISTAIDLSIDDGPLQSIFQEVSDEIEKRVVRSIVIMQEGTSNIENLLSEMTVSDDLELNAVRKRNMLKKFKPSLIESLYIANHDIFLKEDVKVDSDVLLMESISQYTLLETLSSLGILNLNELDISLLAQRLATIRSK
jgi:hypothetical protein